MTRKKVTIERFSASKLRPKKIKKFSVEKFIEVSKKLEKAIKKEDKESGDTSRIFA